MKKRPDLKKRLEELRHEPQQPVELTLRLDADTYQKLQSAALEKNLSVAAFVAELINQYLIQSDNEPDA